MGKQVLLNCRIFAGAADLTGASNKLDLAATVEKKVSTTFASQGSEECLGGLGSGKFDVEGFWEAADLTKVDDAAWAALGNPGAWTACPNDATVGAVGYFLNGLESDYSFLGEVGEIAPYKASVVSASWPVVRGQIAHPPGTARTVTGVGSSVQLGAVPVGKSLYAALHVLSVAGGATPTITARVEADNATGFPSPITVATFAAATTPGGQILRAAGPITDDWFRLAWTITGTGPPSFLLVATLGIA